MITLLTMMSIKNGIVSSMCLAAGGIVLIAVLGFAFDLLTDEPKRYVPVITVVSTIGLAGLVFCIIQWLGNLDVRYFIADEMRLRREKKTFVIAFYVLGGLMLSVGTSTLMVWVVSTAGLEFLIPEIEYTNVIFEGPLVLLSVIALAVIVPISEELFFRSYLISNFRKLGPTLSVVVSSLVFALFHAGQLEIIVILSTFVTGLILGYVYSRFKSVMPCVLIHGSQNMLVILVTANLN